MNNRYAAGSVLGAAILAVTLAPETARGCACGCGVFDVATSSMFPNDAGGMAFLEGDFMDQKHNRENTAPGPGANNGDKEIRTWFFTTGVQYMFNRKWGVQVEVPYDNRVFKTLGGANGNTLITEHWSQLGDIRLQGLYTGFSPDLSTGLSFGVKLPTGSYTHNNLYGDVDRDNQLGTGSTDILLGIFHRGNVTTDGKVTWFGQALLDAPALTQAHYRPGLELDTAAGLYYNGLSLGRVHITPVAQIIASERTSDTGRNASGGGNDDPGSGTASGYQRVLLSPGIEFHLHPVSLYADVELPVFQDYRGDQLAAHALFKVIMSYHF